MFVDRFWHDFLLWHIRTEHPWDAALYMESWRLGMISFQIALADHITPVLNRLIAKLDWILDGRPTN